MPDEKHIIILTPVFNDWDALRLLMIDINSLIPKWSGTFSLMVVDDGSTSRVDVNRLVELNNKFNEVCVLTVATNLGHQRAIAVGLAQIAKSHTADAVLVMDCDGEDQPSDIPSLLAANDQDPEAIIAARRSRRSEGSVFRIFYGLYKIMFRLLTGQNIDFGNFCLIPGKSLSRMVHMPELWNHLPGSIIRSRCRVIKVPTSRGERYAGKSSMNYLSLMAHGFSAISVFTDFIFIRLLIFTGITSSFAVSGAFVIVWVRVMTDYAIPGWASTLVGLSFVVLIQSITLLMIGIFMMLSNRSIPSFIPAIHAASYILETQLLSAGSDN